MKTHYYLLFFLVLFSLSCGQNQEQTTNSSKDKSPAAQEEVLIITDKQLDFSKFKVTFIELGADRCIPCRMMQPVLKEIAKTYKESFQVVFYDVWKDPAPARQYNIKLIPTQVFINKEGEEIFRHVGFFPKEEIIQMLKGKKIL